MARSEIRGGQIKDDSITGDDVDESTLIITTLQDADGDTKIQIEESSDEDKIRFDTAGVERMIITAGGAVGIGTSSPDNTLHVESPGTTHIKIVSEAGYEAALKLKSGTEASAYVWQPGNTSDLRFYVNGADRMHIDNDGNIGVATTGPDRKLDVLDASNPQLRLTHTDGSKYVDFKATAAGDLEITPSNANGHMVVSSTNNATMLIQSDDAGNGDAQIGFSINAGSNVQWSVGCDDSDGDKFKIGEALIETNTRLTIDGSGNVGIGTTTPTCTLSVAGSYATNVTGINSSNDPGTTYSVAATDHILLINTRPTAQGGIDSAITVTLPAAATFPGRVLTFKDAAGYSDVNAITVQRAGSDTIDGVNTSLSIPNPAGWLTFVSDGVSSWYEIS